MMLFSVASTFAFAESLEFAETDNAVKKFLDETDLKTQDIVLQSWGEDKASALLIHFDDDGNNLHLVSRSDGAENSHVQLNSTGIYLGSADAATLLRYATVTTVMQEITKALDTMLEEASKSVPQEQLPTQAQIQEAIGNMAILSSAVAAQEQADAATLTSAAMAFYSKFKPEYILDVKEDGGDVQISLRSEAFATALAEAMDELMLNPALAELVDREAALEDGTTFAEIQKDWLTNREAILEAARSIESTEELTENGHYKSHFKIGEELSAVKILNCDTDAWINAEDGKAEAIIAMGFEKEDPFMVYEFIVNPYYYWERLSSGESKSELYYEIEDNRISSGNVLTVIDGNEELRADFAPDHLYMKGPKGGISTSVRETWTGKTRFEVVAETAEGEESSFTMDFYEESDSLVCEMYGKNSESSESAMFKISRIDKVDVEDLSASKDITEITVDSINAELENLLKLVAPETAAAANTK
jgi:hypothetical protein